MTGFQKEGIIGDGSKQEPAGVGAPQGRHLQSVPVAVDYADGSPLPKGFTTRRAG